MPIIIGKNKFFTPEEAGEILGLHAVTVRNKMRKGVLPGRKVGGRWYISEAKLDAAFSGDWEPEPPAPATDPDQGN